MSGSSDAPAQRLQRAPVVALPVAHEAHVVPHSVRLGLRPEDGGERLLRAVVVLQREIGHAELVEEGEVVGGPPARPFQRDHRLRRFALGEQGEAGVVERVQVVGVLGEGLAEEGKGFVVAAVLVRENGLGDEDVGFTLLGARRGGEREQQCRPERDDQGEAAGGTGASGSAHWLRFYQMAAVESRFNAAAASGDSGSARGSARRSSDS